MARTRDELTGTPPAREVADLETFAQTIDTAQRCNATAVQRGHLELTYPSRAQLAEFARRTDALVVRIRDDTTLAGLGVFVEDTQRGGAQIRWLVIPLGPNFETVAKEIIDTGLDRYGHVWGRVDNPAVHTAIQAADPAYRPATDDPRILEARR